MPCILRDHCFVLVFVASLCNGIEAASHTSRDAHTVMVPELPVELASVSDGNHTLAQSEDLAAAIASTWGLSSSFALAQLASTDCSQVC